MRQDAATAKPPDRTSQEGDQHDNSEQGNVDGRLRPSVKRRLTIFEEPAHLEPGARNEDAARFRN
jgi:hypothetical protein